MLRSMVQQGAHAALSSIRRDPAGRFAGLAAGQAYSAPAWTYYRDGYWTVQPLLALAPEAVRDEIDMLAAGIQPDGEAPSAVILSGPQQSVAWEVFRRTDPHLEEHPRPGDWWSDHFDSPLFFILMIADYVRATGDTARRRRHWPMIRTIYRRYRGFDVAGDGLPVKPNHERDWADNVYRQGWSPTTSACGSARSTPSPGWAATATRSWPPEAAEVASRAREAIGRRLWLEDAGLVRRIPQRRRLHRGPSHHRQPDACCAPTRYRRTGPRATLKAMQRWLYSGANADQPYGDWGVLSRLPRPTSGGATPRPIGLRLPLSQRPRLALLGRRAGARAAAPRLAGLAPPLLLRWWESCLSEWLARRRRIFQPAPAAARCCRAGAACPPGWRWNSHRRSSPDRRDHRGP